MGLSSSKIDLAHNVWYLDLMGQTMGDRDSSGVDCQLVSRSRLKWSSFSFALKLDRA